MKTLTLAEQQAVRDEIAKRTRALLSDYSDIQARLQIEGVLIGILGEHGVDYSLGVLRSWLVAKS